MAEPGSPAPHDGYCARREAHRTSTSSRPPNVGIGTTMCAAGPCADRRTTPSSSTTTPADLPDPRFEAQLRQLTPAVMLRVDGGERLVDLRTAELDEKSILLGSLATAVR